uniref:Uncharacterized protein n=1 Tax=Hucho hucho TaxID=62062 RepID=A0A4W5JSA4_9TELE
MCVVAPPGYAPLPGGLYPTPYHLPLGNLEPPPPSLGLAPHHHLYNTPHQERFFLPVSLPQPPLHPSSAPPSSTPQSSSREVGRDRDRLYREEKEREEPQERDRDRLYREEREREEPQERGRDRLYREEREREEPQEGGRDRLYREEREREEPQEGGQNRLYREEREREEPQERGRDRLYREERERDRGERERSREEPRPYSVVDLTQDGRSGERDRHRERERERERDRDREREREAFLLHHSAPRPPQGCSSSGRYPETDDTPTRSPNPNPSPSPHTHTDRLRKTELTYSGGLLPGPTYPANREPIREQRVSAPTYVPSVEVYDERIGPIQIASQARDKHDKLRERERERERESSRFPEKTLLDHRSSLPGDLSNQREREEGSVICSNGSALKRDGYVSQSGFSPDPRDTPKHAIRLGLERVGEEPKWNPISPLANYATSHMAALASQHGHAHSQHTHAHSAQQARTHTQPSHNNQQELNRPPSNPHTPQHGHTHTQPSHHNQHELNRPPSNPNTPQHRHTHSPHPQPQRGEEGQRRFLDTSALYRPVGGRGGSRGGGSEGGAEGGEVSAMQSLIKYSGTFPPEGQGSSRQNTDNQAAFGGLAFMRLEGGGAGGRLTKREQERPDSTRSLGRGEGAGPGEGGGEVRHPPVGIAVAVARQRDSSSTDSQRPLVLHAGVKGEAGYFLYQGDNCGLDMWGGGQTVFICFDILRHFLQFYTV